MVKKHLKVTADPNLVNFHFTNTPIPSTNQQQLQQQRSGGGRDRNHHRNTTTHHSNHNNNHHNKKKHQNHRTAEDRASSRKKISTHMFPLHSSPDHAFVISRLSCSVAGSQPHQPKTTAVVRTTGTTSYTFQGPDRPVSWESVRIVKCFTPVVNKASIDDDDHVGTTTTTNNIYTTGGGCISCPICLDDNCICPRITKCGHTFCFTCIVQHIQTFHDKTTNPKCPCCSIPIYMNDLRPIQIIPITVITTTTPPTAIRRSKQNNNDERGVATPQMTKMQFIKLHRNKHCSTPYIPNIHQPRHCSPYAIPCHMTDMDHMYCKFNYLHIPAYIELLQDNEQELLRYQRQLHSYQHNGSMMEDMVLGLVIQFVQQELIQYNSIHSQSPTVSLETQLQQQYSNVGTGFYTAQVPSLIYNNNNQQNGTINNNNNNNNSHHFNSDTTMEQQHQSSSSSSSSSCENNKNHFETKKKESMSTSWDNKNDNSNSSDDPHMAKVDTLDDLNRDDSNNSHQRQYRDRGNSITSVHRTGSTSMKSNHHHHHHHHHHGSIYATDDEYVFYQAHDGSLCFLSGFNMNCLRSEFGATIPSHSSNVDNNTTSTGCMEELSLDHSWNDDHKNDESVPNSAGSLGPSQQTRQNHHTLTIPPLPDLVEGHVVDIERIQLTPEMRERRRFLSHIPLYTDISFIEIDLNHVLSPRTKQLYKKEFTKRQQIRMTREKAEQKEDELIQQFEQQQIDERKARMQRIDPMDGFFLPTQTDDIMEPNMLSEDFGPAMTSATTVAITSATPGISFSQVCKSGESIPNVTAAPTEMNFPALGSSPPSPKATSMMMMKKAPTRQWGSTIKSLQPDIVDALPAATTLVSPEAVPPVHGKKNKNKKIVLFSTGAHRNDYF